jgi:hypothetical protein
MTATSAHLTRLLVGTIDVSCIGMSQSGEASKPVLERTAFCDTSKTFIPLDGMRTGTRTIGAFFDESGAAGGYWAVLTAAHSADTLLPISVCPQGISAGSIATLMAAYEVKYAMSSDVGAGVDLSLDFTPSGIVAHGHNLTSHAAVTTTSTSSNLDGGAASANGGVAHLNVTAVSGTTPTLDIILEHSVDGSTSWATLATFTSLTTTTAAERVVVAAGTTVRRYIRASFTAGGTSPSYTLAVAFARS